MKIEYGRLISIDENDIIDGKFVVPEGVTTIGFRVFQNNQKLKEIIIPEGVKYILYEAFQYCENLTSVTLPQSLSEISHNAFAGCRSLRKVEIQEGLTIIDECAFENCESLQEINLPSSLHTIGMRAFENCSSLSVIDIRSDNVDVGFNAFLACPNVKSMKMPICSDFHYLAERSTQLEEIKNPDEEKYKVIDGVLYSKDGTELIKYPKYLNASSFTVPNGVKIISYRAFENCASLKKVVLPSGLVEIGDRAFDGCSSLKDIKIPDTVTGLWDEAFIYCSALKNIEIPDSVKVVGSSMFYGCESLEKIKIFGEEIPLEKFENLERPLRSNYEFVRYAIKNKKFLPKNLSILRNTPNTEIENYYKCSKAWAALQKEYIALYEGHQFSESIVNLYQLCVALGFFHQNRTNEVMDFIRKNIFPIEPKKLHEYVGSMDTLRYGFVEEFADFFIQNYHAPRTDVFEDVGSVEIPFLWYYDEDIDDLVNCVGIAYQNWTTKVKSAYPNRAVMAHREAESETESFTEEIVLNALNSKEYDYSPGYEKLAELCGPYNYSDEDYKNLERWFEKAKSIKPEDMVLRAENDTQSDGVTFKLLAKDDERTAILGELTNCCQVVDDAGSECLQYGMTSKNSGFVEFSYNGRIIGQSWVWYNPETQIVCLDNIEVPARLIPKLNKNKNLYESFIDCLNRLAISFKQAMEKNGCVVKGVTIGSGYTDLDMLDKYYLSVKPQEDYILPEDYTGYSDAKYKQYVIADFTKEKTTEDLLV